MRISSRCEYGCRAMLELAQQPGVTLTAQVIAERREIPEKFLVQILLQLKRAGLVQSVRGAQGGYRLAGSPDQISLLQIIESIDGSIEEQLPGREEGSPEFRPVWRKISKVLRDELREATLLRILDSSRVDEMYYI